MTYQPGLFELNPTFTTPGARPLFSLWCMDVLAALRAMPANSVHVAFFSPPYWMIKDYGHPDQWGQEPTLAAHVANILALFAELRRVLHPSGTVPSQPTVQTVAPVSPVCLKAPIIAVVNMPQLGMSFPTDSLDLILGQARNEDPVHGVFRNGRYFIAASSAEHAQ